MSYDPAACGALCHKCPLQGKQVVPPEANVSELTKMAAVTGALPVFALVGEAPGEMEEKFGKPFVGPSGMELDSAMRSAGLKRRDCHVTNVLLCRPDDNKLAELLTKINKDNKEREKNWRDSCEVAEKTGYPKPPEPVYTMSPIDCCKPRLEKELADFDKFVTLGKTATQAVTGRNESIMNIRGALQELEATERTPRRLVLPTLHPSFVLRTQKWAHVFRSDLHKASRAFRGQAAWKPPKVTYHPPPDVLRTFLSDPNRIYTYDLETDGIESLTARIRCIGIGDEKEVMLVGILGKDGHRRFYLPAEERQIKQILKDFFNDDSKVKAGHNIGYYDRLVLRSQWDCDPTPIVDTILLHKSVESELPHGLAYVGSLYTDAPAWKCYDSKTEVLTPNGWVKFPDLPTGVPIAQWDNGAVTFAEPLAYVNQPYSGTMHALQDQATDLLVTPDHGMIYRPIGAAALKVCAVQDLPRTGYLPHVGTKKGGKDVDLNIVRLIVAAQADGSWMDSPTPKMDFGFTKERKIQRMDQLLSELGIPFTRSDKSKTRFLTQPHPIMDEIYRLLGREKTFGPWLLDWSLEARHVFLDELPFWDGTKGHDHTNYNSTGEQNVDVAQACAVISGRAARKYVYPSNNGDCTLYRLSLPSGTKRNREWSKIEGLDRTQVDFDDRIYCVTMPARFLLVRRNGLVTVSKNSDREGNKLATGSESDEQLHEYCSVDVAVTAAVLPQLVDQVRLRDQMDVWRMDQRIQVVCADMHTVGMYVDQTARLKEEKKMLQRRHELLGQVRDRLAMPNFNPGSTQQLRAILFDKWKLEAPLEEEERFTSSGDPSTADLVLRSLLTSHDVPDDKRDIIKLIRYYRKVQKVLGTYVVKLRPQGIRIEEDLGWYDDDEDYIDKETRKKYGLAKEGIVDPRTGRMHPGYNAHVAVTGRLSSSKPINAQNFPKGMRGMVCAAPGHVLVGADMDQLELRIAAARWQVQLYLKAFAEGKDPHSMTAFAVFGDEFCKAAGLDPKQFEQSGPLVGASYKNGKFEGTGDDKKMRDLSKAVQYASQYMATVETVHKLICKTEIPSKSGDGTTDLPYALLPLRRVRVMRDNWLKGAFEFENGWEKEINTFRRHGFIREAVTGRRRDFLDGEAPNEIVNFPIQASAAGLMNRAILQIHEQIPLFKWGPGTGIINQCHDSIVVECPEAEAEGVARLMEEAMNQTHPDLPGVTFTATAEIGQTWKQVG